MLSSFLLSLREGLEAALVIGIVLGALRQLGRADCARIAWAGVASAAALSVVVALLLRWLGWSLKGPAEPIFEGVLISIAAALLTWMIFWMERQSRRLRTSLTAGVQEAVCSTGRRGVFLLTFLAVVREGVELALFLTAAAFDSGGVDTTLGAVSGLAAAALLAWLLFASIARLNLRRFFRTTSAVLLLFAAGLIAKAVHEFNEVGWIPAGIDPLWNTGAVLTERSTLGSILRGLFGYTDAPSLSVVIAYVVYLGAIALALRVAVRTCSVDARTAESLHRSIDEPVRLSP
jgi:high-affinity iron transporter